VYQGAAQTKQRATIRSHSCRVHSCRRRGLPSKSIIAERPSLTIPDCPCDDNTRLILFRLTIKVYMSRQPPTADPSTTKVSNGAHMIIVARNKDGHQKDRRRGPPLIKVEDIFAMGSNRLATMAMHRCVGPNRSGGLTTLAALSAASGLHYST
jgi:hypothetical protein